MMPCCLSRMVDARWPQSASEPVAPHTSGHCFPGLPLSMLSEPVNGLLPCHVHVCLLRMTLSTSHADAAVLRSAGEQHHEQKRVLERARRWAVAVAGHFTLHGCRNAHISTMCIEKQRRTVANKHCWHPSAEHGVGLAGHCWPYRCASAM